MPSATAALATGAIATAGNPAAGQRGKFLQLPRFKIRVLDPVSGAVLIDPLPHPNIIEFEDILPQSGMAGSSAIPACTIILYHPQTNEYAWAKTQYDKLDQMQRIELYLAEADDVGVIGDPCFTGCIMDLPKSEMDFRINAKDSLVLLELSRSLQSDSFNDTTDQLVRYALKTYQLTKGDDWTGTLAAYTNDGAWSLVTDQGFKSVKTGLASDGLLYTTASYANSKYADCFIEAPYHLTCNSATDARAEAGLIGAVTDSNNMVLGRALMRQVGVTQYYIDAEIWQKSGGVWTNKAWVQNVISEAGPIAQVTVTLVGLQKSATQYQWRVLVNDIDSNCTWTQTVATGSPTGGIGLRASAANSAAAAHHHLVFCSKSNAFQPGNIATGTQIVNQPIPGQQNVDLLMLAMSTEGGVWQKRPKAGLNNDVIDFGVSTGSDLSGIVRFEGDVGNLVSFQAEGNAERLNTGLVVGGLDAYNHRGRHRWFDIPAINKRGLVVGTAINRQAVDAFSLRQMAQNILLRRKQPTQAGRATVARVEDHAELPGRPTPTGMAYRAGDWVTVHDPKQGIHYQRKQLMSAKVQSGNPVMECTTDQYPIVLDREPLVDRQQSIIESMHLGGDQDSRRAPNGVVYDREVVIGINPFKMRVYLSSANQTVLFNTTPTIAFDTVSSDPLNVFNTSTHGWTVPVDGDYQFDIIALCTPPATVGERSCYVQLLSANAGGAAVASGPVANFYNAGGGSIFVGCSASGWVSLVKGDVVTAQFVPGVEAVGSWTLNGGGIGNFTYWSMHRVNG